MEQNNLIPLDNFEPLFLCILGDFPNGFILGIVGNHEVSSEYKSRLHHARYIFSIQIFSFPSLTTEEVKNKPPPLHLHEFEASLHIRVSSTLKQFTS